jgi:hypothetical protein
VPVFRRDLIANVAGLTGVPSNQTAGLILPLASALPADEITFWKWQEHAVYSRIIFGTVYELRLEVGGSHVIDDEQSAGHEARDYFLVGLGVELWGLKIRKAKRDLLEPGNVVESVAMNGLDRTCRSGAGHVFSGQGDFLFIELDRRQRHASRTTASDSHRLEYPQLLPSSINAPCGADIARSERQLRSKRAGLGQWSDVKECRLR